MRFDTKALLKLMKQSWRGGGVKIQRTEHRGLWDSFFITGAGWALLIPKENCPGEIAGQIVTWLADPVRRRRPGRSVPSGRFCRGAGRCEPRLSGYGGRHRLLERRRHPRPVLAL